MLPGSCSDERRFQVGSAKFALVPLVVAYHRPTDLTEALDLLSSEKRVPLAGGTVINADRQPSDLEAVDLQGLGLDSVERNGDRVTLGAMVRLDTIMGLGDDLLAEAARRELPSTLRTLATVGGTIGTAEADSLLIAALLVSDCVVHRADGQLVELASYMLDPSGLILSVEFTIGGHGHIECTGRTPMDTPIVAAVGRKLDSEPAVALTGVDVRPIRLEPGASAEALSPPADFRGSTEYRRHLAVTLAARVKECLS